MPSLAELIESANTGADAIQRAPIVQEDTGVRCLRIGDISQRKPFQEWGFTNAKPDIVKRFQLKKGDIIIARTGNTIGVNKLIREDLQSVYNNGLIRLRVNTLLTVPEFIYYNLQTDTFRQFILSIAFGTSTQPNMQIKDMLSYEVAKISKKEQRAIAHILGTLDDKIELNRKMNKTLEAMAQELFKSWFVEKKLIDQTILFGDLVQPKKGKTITKADVQEGKVPVVAGGIEPSCYHNIPNTKSPVITVSASGANAGFVNLYHIPVWSSDSSFIDYSITPYVYFSYVFLKLNQKTLFEKQEGSAQPHIYPRHLMNLKMPLVSEQQLTKYENIVSFWFKKIKENTQQNTTLTSLRNLLLPKLISGQLRIKDAEKILGNIT